MNILKELINKAIEELPEGYNISINLAGKERGVVVECADGIGCTEIWTAINTGDLEADLLTALNNIVEYETAID